MNDNLPPATGLRVSKWTINNQNETVRVIEDANVNDFEQQVAVVYGRARVRLKNFNGQGPRTDDMVNWAQGPFHPRKHGRHGGHRVKVAAQAWCDRKLIELGYSVPEIVVDLPPLPEKPAERPTIYSTKLAPSDTLVKAKQAAQILMAIDKDDRLREQAFDQVYQIIVHAYPKYAPKPRAKSKPKSTPDLKVAGRTVSSKSKTPELTPHEH